MKQQLTIKKVIVVFLVPILTLLLYSFTIPDVSNFHDRIMKLKGKIKSVNYIKYCFEHDTTSRKANQCFNQTKEFDKNGKVTSSIINWGTGWGTRSEYQYSNKGQLEKIAHYDEGNIQFQYDAFQYDKKGRCIKEFNIRDAAMWEQDTICIINQYDKKGNLIEFLEMNSFKQLMFRISYQYDKKNHLIFKTQDSSNYSEYKFDKFGNRIETNVFHNRVFKKTINVISTNKETACERIKSYYQEETLQSEKISCHKFITDSKQNWIIDSVFTNDTLTDILTREIKYY